MYSGTVWHRVGLSVFCSVLIASQLAVAQAGHLDPTFGLGGIVTTDFGDQQRTGNTATANAVVVQPDGKIVVVGAIPGSSGFNVPAVARYTANGRLDTTFGSGGIVSIPSIEDIPFTSVALQADGKIVAVAGGFFGYVVRYTSSGVLDSSFGTGGIVTLTFIEGLSPSGVVIEPDGDILIVDGSLFRLLPSGQLDTSFGNGGTARTAGYQGTALALLPSGKILVASSVLGTSGFISQYDTNGALDTTFGIDGQLASPGSAVGLVLLSTGSFVAGGSLTNNSVPPVSGIAASGFAVSRFLSAGLTDASFGTNGGTTTFLPGYQSITTSGIAAQPSGDIVLLATVSFGSQPAFGLARYTPGGALDTTFGNNGTVVTMIGLGASVSANGITVQPDGKILAVGSYSMFIPYHGVDMAFKIVRYLGQ